MAKNIVLLYGQQSCKHFNKLLCNWSLLFKPEDWEHCCFVLVTDDADLASSVPASAAPYVQGRIVTLPPSQLANASTAVFTFVKGAVKGAPPVMLYSICSGSGNRELDGAALNTFVVNLNKVYDGGLKPVFFDLITSEDGALNPQYTFLAALCNHHMNEKAAFYLLSDTNANKDQVDSVTQWAALDNELGKSIKTLVVTIPGAVYSLGYVALNPDQMELVSIQERAILEQIILPYLDKQRNESSAVSIWRLLSNNHPDFPSGESKKDPIILEWIKSMIGGSVIIPDEVKRKNNRILGAVYDGDLNLQQYSRHILQFYRMNTATDKFEERAEAYFGEKYARMLTDPASMYLDEHALDMLNRLQDKLKFFAEAKLQEFVPPAIDAKTLFERETHYRDRCCERIEEKAKGYCFNEAIKKMAGIMSEKLERFKVFCQGRKDFAPPFGNRVISHVQYLTLQGKYPKYSERIRTETDFQEKMLERKLLETHLTLFRADGGIEAGNWHQALDGLLEVLKKSLNDHRTYLRVVSDEKPADLLFTDFLNRYLGGTDCMLFYIDGAAAMETHYFIDDDLETHPWTLSHKDEVMIVDNDNVERVDRYTIVEPLGGGSTISDLLTINNSTFPYFRADEPALDEEAMNPVEGAILRTVHVNITDSGTNAGGPATVQQNNEANAASSNHFNMGITLQRDPASDHYAVCWQWPPQTTLLILNIWKDNQIVMGPIPVIAPASKYVLPGLPYGQIQIVMDGTDKTGKKYRDAASVAGMQDLVRFRINNTDHQKVRITLGGKTSYMNEVLVKNTAPDGSVTVYPVAAQGSGQYENLIFYGNTQVMVDPQLKYPRVRVMPG